MKIISKTELNVAVSDKQTPVIKLKVSFHITLKNIIYVTMLQ